RYLARADLHSFPTRRSSDLRAQSRLPERLAEVMAGTIGDDPRTVETIVGNYRAKFPEPEPEEPEPATAENVRRIGAIEESAAARSEEHTSELQSRENLVCRL